MFGSEIVHFHAWRSVTHEQCGANGTADANKLNMPGLERAVRLVTLGVHKAAGQRCSVRRNMAGRLFLVRGVCRRRSAEALLEAHSDGLADESLSRVVIGVGLY